MHRIAVALGAVASLLAVDASAQGRRTLDTFVAEANRIPMNPTAVFSPTARRLMGEGETAFRNVGAEIKAAKAAGRTPPACPPDRMNVNSRQLLGFLNGIPAARRQQMSVTDGIRAWMAERYPCRS